MSAGDTEMDIMPSEGRQRLFHANLERIEHLYQQSIQDGVEEPVVFLLDVRDDGSFPFAYIIVRSFW